MEDKFMAERKSPLMAIIGKDGPQGFETADGLEIDLGASGEGTKIYIHQVVFDRPNDGGRIEIVAVVPTKRKIKNLIELFDMVASGYALVSYVSLYLREEDGSYKSYSGFISSQNILYYTTADPEYPKINISDLALTDDEYMLDISDTIRDWKLQDL